MLALLVVCIFHRNNRTSWIPIVKTGKVHKEFWSEFWSKKQLMLWLWSMRSNTKLILMELATLIWQRHISKMSLTFTLTFFYKVRCTVISIKGDLIPESIFILVPLSKKYIKSLPINFSIKLKSLTESVFVSLFEVWTKMTKNIFWDLVTFIVDQTCQYAVCIIHEFSNFSADFQTILSYD